MTRIAFDPHLPLALLVALGVAAILVTGFSIWRGARGAWARGLAFAILLFALSSPLLVRESHAPLPDVVALVTDRSQSMGVGTRSTQAAAALNTLRQRLAREPNLIVRETSIATSTTGENNGTEAFSAIRSALGDVPQSRIAGRHPADRWRSA